MTQPKQFAAEARSLADQFGIDASAARSLLTYLADRIHANPAFQKIVTSGTPEEKAAEMRQCAQ